jgi:hypothetical protein
LYFRPFEGCGPPPSRAAGALGIVHLAGIASRAYRAAYEVATLAERAESESVRLRALRSIFSGAIATSKFAVLKRRMSAIKEQLHERAETAGASCPAAPCSLVDTRFINHKRRHFVSFFLGRKTPSRGAGALRISFRRCDIRLGPARFRRVQSLVAQVRRKAVDNFGRCSLPPVSLLGAAPRCPLVGLQPDALQRK